MTFKRVLRNTAIGLGALYIGTGLGFQGYHFLRKKGVEFQISFDASQTRKVISRAEDVIKEYGTETGEDKWEIESGRAKFKLSKDCLEIRISEFQKGKD